MSLPIRTSVLSSWRDWMGICASVGCAVHCAAMPFVLAWLPGLGLSFLADEAFHKWMFLVCVLIGLSAFVPGWRKHRQWSPLFVGCAGLGLIGFAAFGLAGDCCSTCEADSSVGVSESQAACCTAGCCDHSREDTDVLPQPNEGHQESRAVAIEANSAGFSLAALWGPWITPVGGVLLIGAHLLNRRYGCICGCCEARSESRFVSDEIQSGGSIHHVDF